MPIRTVTEPCSTTCDRMLVAFAGNSLGHVSKDHEFRNRQVGS